MKKLVQGTQKSVLASWRTSLAGLLTFISVAWPEVAKEFDSDPETTMNWIVVRTAAAAFVGLLAARDNGVSSEQAKTVWP